MKIFCKYIYVLLVICIAKNLIRSTLKAISFNVLIDLHPDFLKNSISNIALS